MDRTLWLIECAHKGDKKAREAVLSNPELKKKIDIREEAQKMMI